MKKLSNRRLILFLIIIFVVIAVALVLILTRLKKQEDVPDANQELPTVNLVNLNNLADYMTRSGINSIYTDADIILEVQKIIDNYVSEDAELQKSENSITDDNLFESQLARTLSNFSFIGLSQLKDIEDENTTFNLLLTRKLYNDTKNELYTTFADTKFINEDYVILNYERYDYAFNDTLITDLLKLEDEEYNVTLVSLYPATNYTATEYERLFGVKAYFPQLIFDEGNQLEYFEQINTLIFSECIHDEADNIDNSTNDTTTLNHIDRYILCIDPEELYRRLNNENYYTDFIKDQLETLILSHNDTTFSLFFPTYAIEHYENYTENDYDILTQSYFLLSSALDSYTNIEYHYITNNEWLYDNSFLFADKDSALLDEEIALTVFGNFIANSYLVDSNKLMQEVSELCEIAKNYEKPEYPDFSNKQVIVLGDSIFGLQKDDTGISEFMSNHTGSSLLNLSIGGASMSPTNGCGIAYDELSDLDMIDAFIKGNPSKETIFLLEFGLNDYFSNAPIDNPEDKYDNTTFLGAYRTVIAKITENWPTSQILLIVPGYITDFNNGNSPLQEGGNTLPPYREAVYSLADEYALPLFDQLTELGISQETFREYAVDGVHYNERGRYTFSKALIRFTAENFTN